MLDASGNTLSNNKDRKLEAFHYFRHQYLDRETDFITEKIDLVDLFPVMLNEDDNAIVDTPKTSCHIPSS